MTLIRRLLGVTPILAVSACGSAGGPASSVASRPAAGGCPAGVVAYVGRVAGGRVTAAPFVAPSGAQGCRVRAADGPQVTITIDTAPQAYVRLERQIVETGQVFGARRMVPAPVHVGGVGLDASWFPGLQEVLTATSRALIGVGVAWTGQAAGRREAAAVAIARLLAGGSG